MNEQTSDRAKGIIEGLEDAIAHASGKPNHARMTTYNFANAKAIRQRLGMSQNEFSRAYGIPLNTLQNWEQGRNSPDRTASAYLWAIKDFPVQISEAQMRHRDFLSGEDAVAF